MKVKEMIRQLLDANLEHEVFIYDDGNRLPAMLVDLGNTDCVDINVSRPENQEVEYQYRGILHFSFQITSATEPSPHRVDEKLKLNAECLFRNEGLDGFYTAYEVENL